MGCDKGKHRRLPPVIQQWIQQIKTRLLQWIPIGYTPVLFVESKLKHIVLLWNCSIVLSYASRISMMCPFALLTFCANRPGICPRMFPATRGALIKVPLDTRIRGLG